MPHKRTPAEWESNEEFCTIAAVAWWDDYSRATGKIKVQAATRTACSKRLALRYEGFALGEFLEKEITGLRTAVDAMGRHIQKQAKAAAKAAGG